MIITLSLEQFRTIRWGTANGRIIEIGDLTDDHLANVIHHCQQTPQVYPANFIPMLLREADSRNLTEYFLSRAPIPWQDEDGKWKRLNIEQGEYEVIGR